MVPEHQAANMPFSDCLVAEQLYRAAELRELIAYPHPISCVLIDLRCLNEKMAAGPGNRFLNNCLTEDETAMLGRFSLEKRKREWLGGRLAAKTAVTRLAVQPTSAKTWGDWQGYSILARENGRPYLAVADRQTDQSGPGVSISHSGSFAAAIAVDHGCGGIDIQQLSSKVIKVKDRFCTPGEERLLHDSLSPAAATAAGQLTKLWAAKEALRKAFSSQALPGFLQMELIEITGERTKDSDAPRGFILRMAPNGGFSCTTCRVSVTEIGDYCLAITAMSAYPT